MVYLHFNSMLYKQLCSRHRTFDRCVNHIHIHCIPSLKLRREPHFTYRPSPITHLPGATSLASLHSTPLHFSSARRSRAALSLEIVCQKQTCSSPPISCFIQFICIIYIYACTHIHTYIYIYVVTYASLPKKPNTIVHDFLVICGMTPFR